MNRVILASALFLFINGCSSLYLESECKSAWDSLKSSGNSKNVKTLVEEDCAILYKEDWIKSENNHQGKVNRAKCAPAWNNLVSDDYNYEAKFVIRNQCPALYPSKTDQKNL